MAATAPTTCSQVSSTSNSGRTASARATCCLGGGSARIHADRHGDRCRNQAGIGHRRQFDDPYAVAKSRHEPTGRRHRQASFAYSTGAGEGDEAVVGREILDLAQLSVPTDQLGNRLWQVCRRHAPLRLRRGGTLAIPISPTCRVITNFPDELIATAGNRADQVAVGSKRGAQRRDL